MILYRGVNEKMYLEGRGLVPKERIEFKKTPKWGTQWGSTWGASEKNAVFEHQVDQKGNPTSGISTTPHIERAKFYASENGYIYVIDSKLCNEHNVKIFLVSEHVSHPSIPEDDEVILVSHNFDTLPDEVITNVINSKT